MYITSGVFMLVIKFYENKIKPVYMLIAKWTTVPVCILPMGKQSM